MLDKKIILLSSGELRKFQLAKTLLTAPRVLIMDNPFIGLDAPTRELLFSLLDRLTKMSSVQIILVLSMLDDIPSFITHVIPVDKMEVFPKMEREVYLDAFRSRDTVVPFDDLQQRIIDLPYNGNNYDADEVVKLNKVSIRYGDRTILKELDWTVHRGEKWALSGENGAGKSTLLSLVCADNPNRMPVISACSDEKEEPGRVSGKLRNTLATSVRRCIVLTLKTCRLLRL